MVRWLALFQATRDAIRAERAMRDAGIDGLSVPVPRYLSAECGIALEFDERDKPAMERILGQLGCPWNIAARRG
jgi:hypothetical protein